MVHDRGAQFPRRDGGYDNVLRISVAVHRHDWRQLAGHHVGVQVGANNDSSIAYPFFVSIQILLTMTAMNIFVAVFVDIDEVRAETHHSAFADRKRTRRRGRGPR